jgi:hypothetical protein
MAKASKRRKPAAARRKPAADHVSRTSEYHQSVADKICQELAGGKSLRKVCASKTMPHLATVMRWVRDNAEFRKQYAEACDARAECLAGEIIEIADRTSKNVARDRLRVEARKWMLPRLDPKKYGDRIAVEASGPDGGPIETKSLSDIEAARLIGRLLMKTAAFQERQGEPPQPQTTP